MTVDARFHVVELLGGPLDGKKMDVPIERIEPLEIPALPRAWETGSPRQVARYVVPVMGCNRWLYDRMKWPWPL